MRSRGPKKGRGKKVVLFAWMLLAGLAARQGSGWTSPPPQEYGRIVIDRYSHKAGMAPVAFNHWSHRALFTCRLCHVDIGFSMEEGGTDIRAADNKAGLYCGACHNGKMKFGSGSVFEACSPKPAPADAERCRKCHAPVKRGGKDGNFIRFIEKFPKDIFGNGVDWEKAEEKGYIKPVDFLEGVSIGRVAARAQQDFSVKSKSTWMSDIKFSHRKHLSWLGCETCHPDIFMIKKGSTQYTMLDITGGKYCGACHDKVAFPLNDCQRCHIGPVGQ
ncbi:MAG TPA: c(7)-type cytochrome triheme domain-containing protein [Nitrospirota bacterium]